ncbi:MAG: hypothetical protein MP439_05605 [Ferrimicrobium sp.]|nr:hypothetical protein [Ferrimicrobium sp.]
MEVFLSIRVKNQFFEKGNAIRHKLVKYNDQPAIVNPFILGDQRLTAISLGILRMEQRRLRGVSDYWFFELQIVHPEENMTGFPSRR